jgi:hypothetical protein
MRHLTLFVLALFTVASLFFGQREHAARAFARRAKDSDQARPKTDNDALKETLVTLEKQSWEAWQKRDGKFFQNFLADDHVEVGFGGVTNKATVVGGVASPLCVVKSYAVDRFELTTFNADTALLTYHAAQDTTCGGHPVPSPVWVSSLYVRRGGRWLNALYQQTQTRT